MEKRIASNYKPTFAANGSA